MKKKILLGLAVWPALLFAQDDFTLKGKITTIKPTAKVFIQYADNGQRVIDSAQVSAGAFQYQATVSEPTQAIVILSADGLSMSDLRNQQSPPDHKMLYLSKGDILLTGENLETAKVSGTTLNAEFEAYNNSLKPIEKALSAINGEYAEAPEEKQQDETFIASLQDKAAAILDQQQELNKTFVKNNTQSFVALSVLDEMASPENLTEFAQPAYQNLSSALKQSTLGKSLGEKLEKMSFLAVGAVAPDFTLPDTVGNPVALSSLRGKYVLVDFWASWCGPCRQENPHVVAAFNKYKDKGFTIMGVSLDEERQKEKWMKAIADDKLEQWTQVSDLKGWGSDVATLYNITSIPQNYLLDPEGKIVASNLRGAALEAKLAEIFVK